MPHKTYDAVVIGLGSSGGATLYHLAKAGLRVLGIDRFLPPHNRGSSHGHTRIYRQAYYEAPVYVPMALRALDLWHELERDTGRTLFENVGGLTIGKETDELISGALFSAQQHGIAHELLAIDEITLRFPAFSPPADTIGLFEPTAGVLHAVLCVQSHLEMATAAGAELRTNETVTAIDTAVDGVVTVHTGAGIYECGRLVVAAGAWAPRLLGLEASFHVTRETVSWFGCTLPSARAQNCPVSMIALHDGRMLYTLPDFGGGFKAGLHHSGLTGDAHLDHEPVSLIDSETVAKEVARYAPGGFGPLRESVPCFYTSTHDQHFAIGPLDWAPNVILAAACSGHGFKFAPAIGESVARMVQSLPTELPMDVFDVARLGAPAHL
ncbi:MAG: N-methyl-L-tryptophan oxidase [Phycisphaerae bacterium]|nr:N-methyl-L-tryptophan oxidase [Gemmatimonadaceae bacterium]